MQSYRIEYQNFSGLRRIAADLILFAGDLRVVTIQGDLGAGKTTLVKELCRISGVTDPVTSPTFTLVNEYQTPAGETLYHIDLYRLENEKEAEGLGLEEIFDAQAWCFIEWPEKIIDYLPDNFLSLKIEVEAHTRDRIITARHAGES